MHVGYWRPDIPGDLNDTLLEWISAFGELHEFQALTSTKGSIMVLCVTPCARLELAS